MKVKQLIDRLNKLPDDKEIICQLIPDEGHNAWNMFFDVTEVENSRFIQLRIFHPELKELPKIDEQT